VLGALSTTGSLRSTEGVVDLEHGGSDDTLKPIYERLQTMVK